MRKELTKLKSKKTADHHVINFEKYLGLLLKWNRAYNLTAITDPMEVYEKHFADSATVLPFIPDQSSVADIGTGAGFPGIPIKILKGDIKVTLIDATEKKATFCEHVVRELRLKDIRVIRGRAEDEGIRKKAGRFDAVISRATLKLPTFMRVGAPYLKKGGKLIAMLGAGWSDELDRAIKDLKKYGFKLGKVHEYSLPITQSKRALLVFTKT